MTLIERVEVSAGRAPAAARGAGAGLRANDGIIASTDWAGAGLAGAGRGGGAVRAGAGGACVVAFGAGVRAAMPARGGVATFGGTAWTRAEVAGDAVLPAAEAAVGGAVVLRGGDSIAGLAGAVAAVAGAGVLAAMGKGAEVAASTWGRAGAGDSAATGAARVAGVPGVGVEPVAGVAALAAALRGGVGAINRSSCAARRGSATVAVGCMGAVACGGTGIGDEGVGCGCAGGIAALAMTACESRADAVGAGAVTALLRDRRGAAGASACAAFGFTGARLRTAVASPGALTLFFGAARRRTGFGGVAAPCGTPGSVLAMLDLRRRGGGGGSASCMRRV